MCLRRRRRRGRFRSHARLAQLPLHHSPHLLECAVQWTHSRYVLVVPSSFCVKKLIHVLSPHFLYPVLVFLKLLAHSTDSPSVMSLMWGLFFLSLLLKCVSAFFSQNVCVVTSFTLGLMSLDMNGLKIVMGSGDEKQAKLASRIAPIRQNGNLLLCTLLLGRIRNKGENRNTQQM